MKIKLSRNQTMAKPKVFFYPVKNIQSANLALLGRNLLDTIIRENKITLEKEVPLKVHTGQPGNITFIKPCHFSQIVDYLLERKIKTYFLETGMVTGPRSKGPTHRTVAQNHGFTQVPFVVADGEDGKDHFLVELESSKHFQSCMIARKLAEQSQIIVLSHFKGHIASGFGAAIKMLGIGFASRQGKIEIHSKTYSPNQETIDWSREEKQHRGKVFIERMADYALAAVNKKKYIYLNYAVSIVENCDCDGVKMSPIYDDLGILGSLDPVAVDKACFDLLVKREGKKPFGGDYVFDYAQKVGLGLQNYQLVKLG